MSVFDPPRDEARVIWEMGSYEDFGFRSFKDLAEMTGLDRARVAEIVRGLAGRGLAVFSSGLMTEDGGMYGSGYALSAKGLRLRSRAGEIVLRPASVDERAERQDARERLGPKDASAVRDSGDAQPQSSTGAGQ